jgi:L-threonylcarbamoyladenylate synthase
VESTVLDLTGSTPVLLRPGGVTLETLQVVIGPVAVAAPGARTQASRSPGTRYRHYAPRARVVLIETAAGQAGPVIAREIRHLWDQGLRVGVMATVEAAPTLPAGVVLRVMGARNDPETIAANLFAQMRELDEAGLDAIVVEGIPEDGVGRAVMDRLRRAAAGGT